MQTEPSVKSSLSDGGTEDQAPGLTPSDSQSTRMWLRGRIGRLALLTAGVSVLAVSVFGIAAAAYGFDWTMKRVVASVLLALVTLSVVLLLARREQTAMIDDRPGVDAAIYYVLLMFAAGLIVILATGWVDLLTLAIIPWILVATVGFGLMLWAAANWSR